MRLKLRKKPTIIIGSIFGIVCIVAAFLWYNFYSSTEYAGINMRPEWDVADNIVSAPGNQVFAGALYNLGYTEFLHGEGPYTVFVPTDKAYTTLSPEIKSYLGSVDNQGSIRQVLLYHVVEGRYLLTDLKNGMKLKTVQGEELTINRQEEYVIINGNSYIETSDVIAKNGVIHIVNQYLLPAALQQ